MQNESLTSRNGGCFAIWLPYTPSDKFFSRVQQALMQPGASMRLVDLVELGMWCGRTGTVSRDRPATLMTAVRIGPIGVRPLMVVAAADSAIQDECQPKANPDRKTKKSVNNQERRAMLIIIVRLATTLQMFQHSR